MMKRIKLLFLGTSIAIFSAIIITPALALMPATLNGKNPESLAPMLEKVTPAIVNITVEKQIPDVIKPYLDPEAIKKLEQKKYVGVGSGIIFNAAQGLIVTNNHVVENGKMIIVNLKDGRHYRAKLIGQDKGFDIAILSINAKHLVAMPFGDSNKLRVGDFVAAIGSPFGLTQTVTSGVISALNRISPKIEGFQSFIQTDAPINPGNSGGALVNLKGELVGINTAIISPDYANSGIGFAIPSNMVKSIVMQLLKYGKVSNGMLGVIAQNITPELADALHIKSNKGVVVTQVIANSPAATAGFKVQDIIEKVNGEEMDTSAKLRNTLGLMRPGTKITLDVLRNHQPMLIHATVGNPNKFMQQQAHKIPYLSGMQLQNFSELETDGNNVSGVLVKTVNDASAGAMAGLIPGDIITQANGKAVHSVNALEAAAKDSKQNLLLKVMRNNLSLFLVIQQDD